MLDDIQRQIEGHLADIYISELQTAPGDGEWWKNDDDPNFDQDLRDREVSEYLEDFREESAKEEELMEQVMQEIIQEERDRLDEMDVMWTALYG